ncbi:MAG: DUF1947 domain-containing protein [Candidatus Helarchaeales archaeon]
MALKIRTRHFIRSKKIREIKEEIQSHGYEFNWDEIMKGKVKIEIAEFMDGTLLYILNGHPLFVRKGELLIPTLQSVIKNQINLSQVVVDMGAIKFLINGADVMAPGILKDQLDDELKKDDVVKIVEEKYHKPIAIGQLLVDASTIKQVNKGKVIKNLHFMGDKLYQTLESVQEKLKT